MRAQVARPGHLHDVDDLGQRQLAPAAQLGLQRVLEQHGAVGGGEHVLVGPREAARLLVVPGDQVLLVDRLRVLGERRRSVAVWRSGFQPFHSVERRARTGNAWSTRLARTGLAPELK